MRPENKIAVGYICAVGAAIFWGFHAVFIKKLINGGVDPILISALRLYLGSAILSLMILATCTFKKRPWPNIKYSKSFWLIVVSLAFNFILFPFGLKYTIASDAVLIEAFASVMVIIILMIFIPERTKYLFSKPGLLNKMILILIIGPIGLSLLLTTDYQSSQKLTGDIIEFIAMVFWALVMIGMHEYQKRQAEENTLAVTAQFLFFTAVLITPLASWNQFHSISQSEWLYIAFIGIFPTGFSYLLWHIASKYLDILPLVVIFNIASIMTVLTETFVLGLDFSWKLAVGGALILYSAMQAKLINEKYKEPIPGE